jgi:hypothetical protein
MKAACGEETLDVEQMWTAVEAMVHTASRRYEKMDNTLRPDRRLCEAMSLEEATKWIMSFDSYLTWNDSIIDRKSLKCVRNLLESHLDTSLLSRMAKDKSITERTTVQDSTGILSRLKGYFVEDSPRTTNRNTNDTEEDQYKSWTTAKSSNPIHSEWIFQAYLRQKQK